MKVLSVDTSGPVVGIALWAGEAAGERTARVRRGAETRLIPWALELCDEVGIGLADLDGVVVARGPGAFTGLRVGLATAAGLGLAAGIPVMGVVSLDHRARAAARESGDTRPVLAMLDARKNKVYAALYGDDGVRICGPADVTPAEALSWPSSSFLATGEGARVYGHHVTDAGGDVASNAEDPAVSELARWAACEGGFSEGSVVPLYLRAPDAQRPGDRRRND